MTRSRPTPSPRPSTAASLLLSVALGTNLAACAVDDDAPATVATASQCGATWDVQNVESYDGTLGVTRTFVDRHQLHVGFHTAVGCSGTLVSDDLFLSAGHCNYQVGHVVRFNYQNAPDGTARPTRDFTVAAVVEQEDTASWDYAIVRLNGSPGRQFGHGTIAAVDPPAGTTVVVIQHPNNVPKVVHAATVLDYASLEGTNWFRHQVDTIGGSSGAGVLDGNGEIVGVHTNAGCNSTGTIAGNSAMRMSQLVPHSPTLQALSRSKLLWWNPGNGRISLWTVNADGSYRSHAEHAAAGWTPLSLWNNRILWRHGDGRISYWTLDDAGNHLTYAESGPYPGWTAISHTNDRILWRHSDGRVWLWTVNAVGNYLSHVEYGPYAGWTPVAYADNRLLWRHTDGTLSMWLLDDAGALQRWANYGQLPAWTLVSYSNGEILWRHTDGRSSLWMIDPLSDTITYRENGPYAPYQPVAGADRKLLWRLPSGEISYWTTNSDGVHMRYAVHGPYAGWTALYTTGGRP